MAFGTSENAPWLSRTPSAGISDGPDDAVRITLSVDVSGLEPGSYSATVRISGRRIGNSSQRVPVTLTVRPPGYARERVSPGERTEIVTPDSTLRLIVPENAASADVDIELEKLDPASQTSPPGEQERVILAVDLQTLAPGSETSSAHHLLPRSGTETAAARARGSLLRRWTREGLPRGARESGSSSTTAARPTTMIASGPYRLLTSFSTLRFDGGRRRVSYRVHMLVGG